MNVNFVSVLVLVLVGGKCNECPSTTLTEPGHDRTRGSPACCSGCACGCLMCFSDRVVYCPNLFLFVIVVFIHLYSLAIKKNNSINNKRTKLPLQIPKTWVTTLLEKLALHAHKIFQFRGGRQRVYIPIKLFEELSLGVVRDFVGV